MNNATATLTISTSSHPEFLYFVDIRINGRQIARRFNDNGAVADFVAEAEASAARNAMAITITDER